MAVNYVAPVDHTGYACAAAQYVRELAAKTEVHFQPLRRGQQLGLWYEPGGREDVPTALQALTDAPLLLEAPTILHTVPEYFAPLTRWLRGKGVRGRILGMTVWETSRLPRHWSALLNQLDGLIVPSMWNAEVFRKSGVDVPIYCVPHLSEFAGVRTAPEHIDSLRRWLPDLQKKFIFYSIGAWQYRKGNDLLVRAFLEAFQGREDVVLLLKTTARSIDVAAPRWRRCLHTVTLRRDPVDALRRGPGAQIQLITDDLAAEQMAALHSLGDCYVTCTRGEGWGMGLYEAVLMDKPIVAPDRGGHRAYLPKSDGSGLYRSRWSPVQLPFADASYTRDQMWVEPDVHAAAQAMQKVKANWSEAQQRAQEAGALARREFLSEKIVADLLQVIERSARLSDG